MAKIRLRAALTLAVAAMLAASAVEKRSALAPEPLTPVTSATPEAARSPPKVSSAQIASLLARPLFSSMRRPVSEPQNGLLGPSTAVLPRLSGIMIAGTVRQAIFALDESGGSVIVGEGGKILSFTVQTIFGSEVILLDGATRISLQPHRMQLMPKPVPRGLDVLNNVLLNPDPP